MTARRDAAEAAANTVVGLIVGWAILRAFGMPSATALAAQATFVAASWLRSFAIRRAFRAGERPETS